MAWPTTTWLNADWANLTNVRAFWAAVNERQDMIWFDGLGNNLMPFPLPDAGADVQSASTEPPVDAADQHSWRFLQSWVQGACPAFYQSHDLDGTPRAAGCFSGILYWTGPYYVPGTLYWTWENLCKAAGLWVDASHYGFRRATAMPDDWTDIADAAYSFGVMQAGDIIGPWIFQDLQKVINLLVWADPPPGFTGGYAAAERRYVDSGFQSSWAAAKAAVEAAWPGTIDYAYGGTPRAMATGEHSGSVFVAWAERYRFKLSITDILGPSVARAVDFYCSNWPGGPAWAGYVFDQQGECTVALHEFQYLGSTPASADAVLAMPDWFGGTTLPTWCDEPAFASWNRRGYGGGLGDTPAQVVRWNVAGGLVYQ